MKPPQLDVKELSARLAADYAQEFGRGDYTVLDAVHGGCRLRLGFRADSLRPGGTISGPTLMKLADIAMYVALLASIGWQPLAVTTSLTINFLRKPTAKPLIADCKLLKLGKRLAVGEVAIRGEGNEALAAHATVTYSIPV